MTIGNSLDRQFDVEEPDRVWVTDITYIRTVEGFAYLAMVRSTSFLAALLVGRCRAARPRMSCCRLRSWPYGEEIRRTGV